MEQEQDPLRRFSDAGLRRVIEELTFPPPSAAELQSLVGRGWEAQLAGGVPTPNDLAGVVLSGFTQAKSLRQIAEDLRPHVDGVASRARTIARTEGLHVAHATQRRAWDQAGDIVAGFQIHSVGDERVRPEHLARDGRVWMRDSGESMQAALRMELPTLPDAWNCRCYLTPVLASTGGI